MIKAKKKMFVEKSKKIRQKRTSEKFDQKIDYVKKYIHKHTISKTLYI